MAFTPGREEMLSEEQLNRGYWWVTHKVQVRRYFTVVLGIVAFVLTSYALFGFADWFFGSGVPERAQMALMSKQWIDYPSFRAAEAPRPLRAESPIVIASGDKKYDVFAKVVNPNTQWWVEFDFRFGDKIPAKHDYLLPGDTKNLAVLGYSTDARPSPSEITIENIAWHRVNLHVTRPDMATWENARLNFTISDAKFVVPEATDPVPVWRAKFRITNGTGFGYFNVGFFVTLLSGSRIVGVNQVVITDLRPGDVRDVEASWFSDVPTVTKVDVKPLVNIFDDHAYIRPGQ
jgi:hypothetical protein